MSFSFLANARHSLVKTDASKLSNALVDECAHGGRQSPGVRINNLHRDRLAFQSLPGRIGSCWTSCRVRSDRTGTCPSRDRTYTHSSVLSISLHTIAQLIGTLIRRRPTRKFHSFRGDSPTCLTQRCARTSCGVRWNTVAAKVSRTSAHDATNLANRNCHERRIVQMSNPDGNVDTFFDHVHHAIHEQHFDIDMLMAQDERAHNRRDVASAE